MKVFKTILLVVLFSLLFMVTPFFLGSVNAAENIEINETNFPDSVFRSYVSKKFDTNNDGCLSSKETLKVKNIDVSRIPINNDDNNPIFDKTDKAIKNLKGIKYFTELQQLNCCHNEITSLNLSKNLNLVNLVCSFNSISTLDLSKCTNLTFVQCNDNKLTSIDISTCMNLRTFLCLNNKLTNVDVSHNELLIDFSCSNNQINSLNLMNNEYLERVICDKNKLTSLDVSNKKHIDVLTCEYNKLSSLYVNGCSSLFRLMCGDNTLKKVDLRGCTSLDEFRCPNNQLTSLNLSDCPLNVYLSCENNNLTSLDVSHCSLMMDLLCYKNQLTKLKVSGCSALIRLCCDSNALTELDLNGCLELSDLVCGGNKLKSLDISNCPYLRDTYKYGYDSQPDKGAFNYYHDIKNRKYNYAPSNQIPGSLETGHFSADRTTKIYDTPLLDRTELTIICGGKKQLKLDAGKNDKIEWKSSDESVITVDNNGNVAGKQAGKAEIKVSVSGRKATCVVFVQFKDVTNSKDFWYEPTYYLVNTDVVKGYDKQTRFKPANNCTRAQMVTFLWRLAGSPVPISKKCSFIDIKKSDYYYKAVLWAFENGITTGTSKTTFTPSGVCTRAQTVTFLWRNAGTPEPKSTKNKFKDVKSSDYFYKAVLWASEKKIVVGYEDGRFKPKDKCLRRQMVTFLYKYDKYVNGKG